MGEACRRCASLFSTAAVAFAVACALTACATGENGKAPAPAHVLRIADLSNPTSLDPLLAHDQDTIGFDLLFTQTLVGLSKDNRVVPILVTRVPSRDNGDVSADGKTIVYHLRRGIRFADGVPLTSADVAFTYRAIMDPRNPVLSEDEYRRVASLTTPDPYTVLVRLRTPWNAAVRELFAQSDFAFGILPAHAFASTSLVGAPWEERAFGTGPFRVTQWRRQDRVVLEPNPYYSPHPKLARIDLVMIPDYNTAAIALRTGEIDVAPLGPAQLSDPQLMSEVRVVRTAVNETAYLSIQTANPPTDDVRVRRAIADALDVPQIESPWHGRLPRAAAFLPPVLEWHDSSRSAITHDQAAAAAELDAAGWSLEHGVRMKDGSPLDVTIVAEGPGTPSTSDASIVQHQLAAVGIDAAIKLFPVAMFNGPDGPLRTGKFNLASSIWIGGADPEQSVVFSCDQIGPDGDNISRFCDRRFEAAFDDQVTTSDDRRRAADFMTMQRIVYDRLPVIPLTYFDYFDGVSPRVTGFARNMLEYPVDAEDWDAR
jgi:peptide/nickel transport system substrate-binding protein